MDHASRVLPAVLATAIRQAPLTPEKIDFAWRAAGGAAIARVTQVTLAEGGVLKVQAQDPQWAKEVHRLRHDLVRQLEPWLGVRRGREDRNRRRRRASATPHEPRRLVISQRVERAVMQEAVIVSAVRIPTGKFLGTLKDMPATDLGALAVREAVSRAGIDPAAVDECIMGNVVSAGPARRRRVRRPSRAACRIPSPRSPSTRCAARASRP